MQRVEVLIDTKKGMINIKSDYLVESYQITELKEISKLLSSNSQLEQLIIDKNRIIANIKATNANTANQVSRNAKEVIQIWNEEKKPDRDRTGSRTLPKRTPNKLVRRIKRRRRRIRKPERSSRAID